MVVIVVVVIVVVDVVVLVIVVVLFKKTYKNQPKLRRIYKPYHSIHSDLDTNTVTS